VNKEDILVSCMHLRCTQPARESSQEGLRVNRTRCRAQWDFVGRILC
jgi:hypothetical protein